MGIFRFNYYYLFYFTLKIFKKGRGYTYIETPLYL
jgi:hypothetical protein